MSGGPARAAWLAVPVMIAVSAHGLIAEVLARRGLSGWSGTLDEPAGELAALIAAQELAGWRADLQVAAGLRRDLPAPERERLLGGAIHSAPSWALGYLALGAARAEDGDETAALRLYSAAEALDRMGSATQIRLGALYLGMMRLDEALPRLGRAARISPDARLGEALKLAATFTSDPELLDSLVPDAPLHRLAAARRLAELGLDPAAELQYERASRADPLSAPILEEHVGFHLRRQEPADAIRLIASRLDRGGSGVAGLRAQLVQLLIDTGRLDEAGRALEAATREAPGSETVADQRALLALASGQTDRAVEIAQGLVDRRPEMAGARVTLARALWTRGDRPGAARELAQAEALDASRPDVQLLLARLSREIGNIPEAARRYGRAIDMGYVSPAREELATLPAAARTGGGG